MDALHREFAATIADTSRGDIEGAFDRAMKRSGLTGRQNRALANLREKCFAKLDRIRDGLVDRVPASLLDEALEGIRAILHGDVKEAIAKRASGPGDRKAPGLHLHRDGMIPDAPPAAAEPEGEALTAALVAAAKEFRELVEKARPVFRKLGAEMSFNRWEGDHHHHMRNALLRRDLKGAQIVMDQARGQLNAQIDEARVAQALGAAGETKALIPNYRPHGGHRR